MPSRLRSANTAVDSAATHDARRAMDVRIGHPGSRTRRHYAPSSRDRQYAFRVRSLAGAELREHLGESVRADVEVFANASPQHRCRDICIAALLLQLMQYVEHDSQLAGQAVADIGYPVIAHRAAAYSVGEAQRARSVRGPVRHHRGSSAGSDGAARRQSPPPGRFGTTRAGTGATLRAVETRHCRAVATAEGQQRPDG